MLMFLLPLRRRGVQVLAGHWGLTPAWRSPAAVALASPPGVHPQPHGGWPDLGAHWSRPSTLRASAFLGARGHTSQHEATGKFPLSVYIFTFELFPRIQNTLQSSEDVLFASFGCGCLELCRRRGPLRSPTEKSSRTAPTRTPPQLNRSNPQLRL